MQVQLYLYWKDFTENLFSFICQSPSYSKLMQLCNNDLKAFVWMNYLLKLNYVQAGQFKITISKRLGKDKPTNSVKIIVQVYNIVFVI